MKALRTMLVLAAATPACAAAPPVVQQVIDHCVSSRWGFTCFAPTKAGLLPGTPARMAARAALLCMSTTVGVWIAHDVRNLRKPVPSALALEDLARKRRASVKQRKAVAPDRWAGVGPPPVCFE